MVEHNLAKVGVASSSLVFRSCENELKVSQSIESRFPLRTRLKVPYASSLVFCPGGGMVDARVSGARAARRAGSIPVLGTIKKRS